MEPTVGQVLVPEYRSGLLIASYLISVLGSFVALECAKSMVRSDGKTDWPMVIGAAISLGGIGIWAMHFIGMLAYRVGVTISYELLPTLISLIAAIIISGCALFLTGGRGRFRISGWIAGSILAGVGVSVMHYLGMYAMNLRATMTLDPATVALSVAIAIGAASAALWLAFNLSTSTLRIMAACVMGIAVCTMHYTGMTAATLICTSEEPAGFLTIRGAHIDLWIVVISIVVLGYVCWISTTRFVDRVFQQQLSRT